MVVRRCQILKGYDLNGYILSIASNFLLFPKAAKDRAIDTEVTVPVTS
jgi:hypothetical protein